MPGSPRKGGSQLPTKRQPVLQGVHGWLLLNAAQPNAKGGRNCGVDSVDIVLGC